MTTPVLEPCPLCGGTASTHGTHGNRRNWWVECVECGATSGTAHSLEIALSMWNERHRRPSPADQRPAQCETCGTSTKVCAVCSERMLQDALERVAMLESDRAARPPRDVQGGDTVDCETCSGPRPRCQATSWRGDRCNLVAGDGHRYHKADNAGWPSASPLPEKEPPRGPIAGCNRCGWKSEPQPDGTSAWIAADQHAREVHGDAARVPEKEPPRGR